MASPQNSLDHLTATAPIKLGTIGYGSLVVNNWGGYQTFSGTLSRNARQRTFVIFNNTDVELTTVALDMLDSTFGGSAGVPGSNVGSNVPAGDYTICTSEEYPHIIAHVDSFETSFQIGATAPTRGTIDVYVVELF